MQYKIEPSRHKLGPKLRMVADGDETVNVLRAEQSPIVAVPDTRVLQRIELQREPEARALIPDQRPEPATVRELERSPKNVFVNVFVQLKRGVDRLPPSIPARRAGLPGAIRKDNLVSAAVPITQLDALLQDPAVISVESAEHVRLYPPLEVAHNVSAPGADRFDFADLEPAAQGQQVLIGIVDVQGFDFSHPDFLDENGKTRFLAIWDQGGNTRPAPSPYGFGSEIREGHVNAAIEAAGYVGLPATELEPQSQMVPSSHGTHVASIAAGNRGVCPEARIAAVLIALPPEDLDRRKSFYDSTRIVHAVDYLFELGRKHGLPVSINISLGTNGHAHDASSVTSRWIDYELATAGRSVCVAAGNAGQEKPAEPGDWGFVMGRIHTSGRVPASGDTQDLEWVVIGDGIVDISENELEIWYSPQDQIAVEIKPPNGDWVGPVRPGEHLENVTLPNGTVLSVYNDLYAPPNGHNYIACYLSPHFSSQGVVGVWAGTWKVRLHGLDIRDGRYHGWIERDDPRRFGRLQTREAWAFPSFFSTETTVDNASVSSLACGQRIISVANLDQADERIHITSSQGPTRDGRHKPEVAAPGTGIVAACGFDPDRPWVSMTGTSMASPYVSGVIARMLAIQPGLTAAQIGGIIQRTAQPLAGSDFSWQDDAGFGRIDPAACLAEVLRLA